MIKIEAGTARNYLIWSGYSVISLLLSLWIAWHALAQVNFLYPFWYSALDIQQTVKTYAPVNRYKPGFQSSDPAEHKRLFAEIVTSVQHKGEGLSGITYLNTQTQQYEPLLTQDEVNHLQDVANLIQRLNFFSVLLGLVTLLLLSRMYALRMLMPSIKRLMLAVVVVTSTATIILIALGAKDIFYWVHTKIFPADHPWFFYYEDSLMSTLMKAPILFAPMSMQLMGVGILIWWAHLVVINKLLFYKPPMRMSNMRK